MTTTAPTTPTDSSSRSARIPRRSSRNRRAGRLVAVAVGLALVVAGCAADDATTEASQQAASPAELGTLATVGGGQIDLNSIEGTDTVLWFWAPW